MNREITLERTELWFCSGTSDKVYNITIYQDTTTKIFKVEAEYGRRNNQNLINTIKYQGPSSNAAWSSYNSTVKAKEKKGYDVESVNQGNIEEKVESYKKLVYDLTANGVILYPQRMQIEALLNSQDPESINTAMQIVDAKREKSAA